MDTFGNVDANSNDTHKALGNNGDSGNAGAHAKINKVSVAAHTAVDSLSAGAHQGFDKALVVASQAAETFEAKRAELKVAQEKLIGISRGYVQQNPLTSLGIAAAVGYVLSRLLKSH